MADKSVDARFTIEFFLKRGVDSNKDGLLSIEELKNDGKIPGSGIIDTVTHAKGNNQEIIAFMEQHNMEKIDSARLADAIAGVCNIKTLSTEPGGKKLLNAFSNAASFTVAGLEEQLVPMEQRQKQDIIFKDDVKYMPIDPKELAAKPGLIQK